MAKYRMKQAAVDAVQFDPAIHPSHREEGSWSCWYTTITANGRAYVRPGDWIVTWPSGVIVVHPPAIFEALFEQMAEETAAPEAVATLETVADPGYERLAAAIEQLTGEIVGLRAETAWRTTQIFGGYQPGDRAPADTNSTGNLPLEFLRDLYRFGL